MAEMLKCFPEDGETRTGVIRGAGDDAFSSGYDIVDLPTEDPAELAEALDNYPFELAIQSIRTFHYPVMAIIDGYAYEGGASSL
jgi:enoyl-CoA hydratase/carnithine racemase